MVTPDGGLAEPERSGDHVQSLVRGLAVIRSLSADRPEMTLSEVARETGLTRAAARRFLLTLADIGYVRTDGRRFGLTPRVLELGYAYLSGAGLPEVAAPHLHWLFEQVEESASASVLDGDDVVDVARVPTRRIMSVGISIGTRFPAVLTSMGRVLLAHAPAATRDAVLARASWEARTPFTVTHPEAVRSEQEIADQSAAHADVLIPLGSVDPNTGKAAVERARRLVTDHGVRGFKFHPSLQAFEPNNSTFYPLYEALQELQVVALFHTGQTGIGAGLPRGPGIKLRYSAPMLIDDVAADSLI